MSKSKSTLANYMDEAGALPSDVLLGHVVMYSVGDGQYDRTAIERHFMQLDLNPAFVPFPNRAIDAYRKATTKYDDYEYRMPSGDTAHVLVRDVAADSTGVTRHLVREVKDSRQRRLAYNQIGEAVFYRGTNGAGSERLRITFDARTFVANEQPHAVALGNLIEEHYTHSINFMDDMKVRGMFRDYVKSLNAIMLRNGVYFVHVSRHDELVKLQKLAVRLSADTGSTCSMWMMPLVDLSEQRDMVIDAYQVEATKALDAITKEISDLRTARKRISGSAYAKIREQYDTVMRQATEYTRTLDVTQDRTAGAAEIAMTSLVALQQQMIRDSA